MRAKLIPGLILATLVANSGCVSLETFEVGESLVAGLGRAPAAAMVPGQVEKISKDLMKQSWDGFVVKFALLKDAQGKFTRLYLIDPSKHELHHQFLGQLPEFKGMDHMQIDEATMVDSPARKAIVGAIHFEKTGANRVGNRSYILTEEAPKAEVVAFLHQAINAAMTEDITAKYGKVQRFSALPAQQDSVAKSANVYRAAGVEI